MWLHICRMYLYYITILLYYIYYIYYYYIYYITILYTILLYYTILYYVYCFIKLYLQTDKKKGFITSRKDSSRQMMKKNPNKHVVEKSIFSML